MKIEPTNLLKVNIEIRGEIIKSYLFYDDEQFRVEQFVNECREFCPECSIQVIKTNENN